MFQLSLRFQNDKDTMKASLEKMTGRPVQLIITDNKTRLLSIRQTPDALSVRMHWMFLKAEDEVVREIAGVVRKRKCRTPLIREFINGNTDCIKVRNPSSRNPVAIRTQGRFHDLKAVFTSLNSTYFDGKVFSSISWGKRNVRRMVKKRILGSFSSHTDTIWISPLLDRKKIPEFYVRYIVYHEMLHSIIKEETKNGRRSPHSRAFRQRERQFGEYEKAMEWEKKHFTANLRDAYHKI